MNEKAPSTPAEWLKFFADLAAKHPLVSLTAAGAEFHRRCIELLENAAAESADMMDLQADLLAILPRFLNAITAAKHNGTASAACASRDAAALYAEIVRDMSELALRQNAGGTH
jgi:hypothetical protein